MTSVHIEFTLNREPVVVDIPTDITALGVIREVLGLTGTKEGCGVGECGACTIEVDGKAVNSCLMHGAQLDGTTVLTVEGLTVDGGSPLHQIQEAFLDNHGVQCGFCTPGVLMSTHALLNEIDTPDDEQIKKAIAGNICRCTGYQQIFSSVKAACSAHAETSDGEAG